jgi:hypothetical protein
MRGRGASIQSVYFDDASFYAGGHVSQLYGSMQFGITNPTYELMWNEWMFGARYATSGLHPIGEGILYSSASSLNAIERGISA